MEAFGGWWPGEVPGNALYTGADCWIEVGGRRTRSTKDGVIAALRAGDVEVVFCSDAASEGLNLQAARVLVNIDVPWNPARLEQRIGRIARIGQTAPVVAIYNLWYPDSVEARMYSRLLARLDLYQVAVGEFPEIMSASIKEALAARYEPGLASVADDPIAVLQELRRQDQRRALARVWGRRVDQDPAADRFRRDLIELLGLRARAAGGSVSDDAEGSTIEHLGIRSHVSGNAGDVDVITLGSRLLDELLVGPPSVDEPADQAIVGAVDADHRPVAFYVEHDTRRWLIPTERFGELLAAVVGSRPLDISSPSSVAALVGSDLGLAVRASARWLPDHGTMRVPFDGRPPAWTDAAPDAAPTWTIRPIGRVAIR